MITPKEKCHQVECGEEKNRTLGPRKFEIDKCSCFSLTIGLNF